MTDNCQTECALECSLACLLPIDCAQDPSKRTHATSEGHHQKRVRPQRCLEAGRRWDRLRGTCPQALRRATLRVAVSQQHCRAAKCDPNPLARQMAFSSEPSGANLYAATTRFRPPAFAR